MTDREWLEALEADIWTKGTTTLRANMSGHTWTSPIWSVKRKLTLEEWERVQALAPAFVVEPHSSQFGFNFALTFRAPPTYPELPCERVFTMEGNHLPEGIPSRFDDAWKVMSPLTHNADNTRLLRLYKLSEPQSKVHYDY